MDDEKLISLVSGYPEIYDLENEHYMNQVRKNNIWFEIGALLGVNDTICKEKWKALRDAYHRSLKRNKSKSGDEAKKIKKWRFESQMEFMRPYFQERISKTNIENTKSDDDDQTSYLKTATSPSASVNSPRPSSRATSTPDLETPGISSKTTSSAIFKNITARKRNKQPLQQSQVSNVLEKYLDSRTTSCPVESINPIQSFFKAMADTVVALSPDLQLKVKNQVYSIVSQAECDNLRETSRVSADYFLPNFTFPQQEQPTTIVVQHENEINDETQCIQQPSQNILQPQPQPRYRYYEYINPDGNITYEKSKPNE